MKFFKYCLLQITKSEIRKNIAILLGGNGISQIVPLILYPVIARLYSPSAFGQLAVLFGIHSLIVTAASGKYELAVILPAEDSRASALMSMGLKIAIIVTALIVSILLVMDGTGNFIGASNIMNPWYYALVITVFAAALAQLLTAWCTRYKLFKTIAASILVLNISTALIKIVLGFLHVKDGLLYAFVIAQLFMTLYLLLFVKKKALMPQWHPFEKHILPVAREYIDFPRYNLAISFLNSFSSNLPVYLLALYFSTDLTGQFSMAFTLLFKPVMFYNSSVYQVMMQKVVEMRHKNEMIWQLIRSFLVKTLWVSLTTGFVLLFAIQPVVQLYLGKNWDTAIHFCRFMIPWAVLSSLAGPLAYIPNIFNKQRKALVIDMVYLGLRFAALLTGILLENVTLAIALFSLAGVLVILYQLCWYRNLVWKNDLKRKYCS